MLEQISSVGEGLAPPERRNIFHKRTVEDAGPYNDERANIEKAILNAK